MLANRCPSCGTHLHVARLSCPSCSTQVEGTFELPPLLCLDPEEMEFVEAFVKASGSLKEMARLRGQSYPTIRNFLDQIIAKLAAPPKAAARTRREILDAVAKGTLSVKDATRLLKEVER